MIMRKLNEKKDLLEPVFIEDLGVIGFYLPYSNNLGNPVSSFTLINHNQNVVHYTIMFSGDNFYSGIISLCSDLLDKIHLQNIIIHMAVDADYNVKRVFTTQNSIRQTLEKYNL